ncbi:MAG TPA: hypothetical protein DDX92_08295 [Flavobacteriales bacterium]|mgnify:CR=1 FL=1|jgi:D-alanyl-D-alanine carboxypeptidase|nr:hypothetical protein [Flavobacteriales bacterium]
MNFASNSTAEYGLNNLNMQLVSHFGLRNIHLLIYAVFVLSSAQSQTFDPTLASDLQNTLDSLRTSENFMGISSAVFLPGQGMWTGVSGESEPGVAISSQMIFGIGSNTKTFTAAALLKLVGNQMLTLDDSLHQWLPSYNPNIDSTITVRQLLNHTSGIANTFDVPGFLDSLEQDRNRIFSTPEILSWLPAPLFAPGMGQSYSNPNYHLAGLLAESVSGQSLEQLMHDSLFNPIGMSHTYFPIYDTLPTSVAHPWHNGMDWNDTARTSLHTSQWSAGAMYSTAEEMALWHHALMSGQLLEPNVFDEMTDFVGPDRRGLGIQEFELNGRTVWGHGGASIGYRSSAVYDTSFHASIIVLINQTPSSPMLVIQELLSAIEEYLNVVGMNDLKEYKPTFYPNPSSNMLTIEADLHSYRRATIYDLNGQRVLSTTESTFSIAGLSPGPYVIQIKAGSEIHTRMLFKQ